MLPARVGPNIGDHHSHDAQIAFIPCGYNYELWHWCLNVDTAKYFDDASKRLAPDAEGMIVLANPGSLRGDPRFQDLVRVGLPQ